MRVNGRATDAIYDGIFPEQPTPMLVTPRLIIRPFIEDDAVFVVALLNDPDWLRFIGDRKVRTLDDARVYLRNGPIAAVARNGSASPPWSALWAYATRCRQAPPCP